MSNEKSTEYIDELVSKINKLNSESQAVWGKMNVSEMMHHCSKFIDLYRVKYLCPNGIKSLEFPLENCFCGMFQIRPLKNPKESKNRQKNYG